MDNSNETEIFVSVNIFLQMKKEKHCQEDTKTMENIYQTYKKARECKTKICKTGHVFIPNCLIFRRFMQNVQIRYITSSIFNNNGR